jgi:hypothetical protein
MRYLDNSNQPGDGVRIFPLSTDLPTTPTIPSWGTGPRMTSPYQTYGATRLITGTDSNFVTLFEQTTPVAIYSPIVCYRNAGANAGQACTFRLYINDVLVDERAHTFTSDGANKRAIHLGWRAPGDAGVDNTPTVAVDLADIALPSWNALTAVNTSKMIHLSCAPQKIRIDMKVTAASVNSTYGTYFVGHGISKGSPQYWSQVVSLRTGAATQNGTSYADVATISGTNLQLMGGLILRWDGTGAASHTARLIIDNNTSLNVYAGIGSASPGTVFARLTPIGINSALPGGPPFVHTAPVGNEALWNFPNFFFTNLKVQTKRDSGASSGNTFRVYAIYGFRI